MPAAGGGAAAPTRSGPGGGGKKPFEETRPDKSGGSIQLPCCWEKGAPLWGEGWPSQPSTCPRPAPPALAPAAAAGPAVCPGACQGCQRGPKCSLSPQLPGLPSGEGLRAAGCSSAAPSGVLWGAAPRPGSAYRGIDVPIPSKSSLASFPALTAPPRAGRRCPPPFALILGMLHVPQSPGGSPGGWERGSGVFDLPHISPAQCTAEPAGPGTTAAASSPCGRQLGWRGDRLKEPLLVFLPPLAAPVVLLVLWGPRDVGEPGRAGEGASPSAPPAVTPGSMRRFRRGK